MEAEAVSLLEYRGLENQILFLVIIINKLKMKNKVIHLRGAICGIIKCLGSNLNLTNSCYF